MKKKPEERMEIREMLRHPFITKYQDQKLPIDIMKDFKEVLSWNLIYSYFVLGFLLQTLNPLLSL